MIVVTTPTGQTGCQLVRNLLDRDLPVRVVVRMPERLAADVAARVDVVVGSHGDAATIDAALEGASALFWLAPPDTSQTMAQAYLDFTRPAVAAIRMHGVARVVSVTALGRGTPWQDRAGLVTASIGMDDLLMSSGAAFRGLAMPTFMDNLLRQADSIRDAGVFYGPIDPDLKAPVTATRDLAAAAARLLSDPDWAGQSEEPVLGPEDLSQNDMAAIMGDVLGRPVRYQQISMDDFRTQLIDRGVTRSFADGYVAMMQAKNEGVDTLARPRARTGTGFRTWAAQALTRR